MKIIEVVIHTPVNSLTIDENELENIIDRLLEIEGIKEVEHYAEFYLTIETKGETDAETLADLDRVRGEAKALFEREGVWPEEAA